MPRDELSDAMSVVIDGESGILGYINATDGRRGREYATGRAKAFEVLEDCLARAGVEVIGDRAKDVLATCSSAFRRETSSGTKAAALKPMVLLAGSGSRTLDAALMKSQARMLRRDYERTVKNTKTVKGLILRVIGAIHTGLALQGAKLLMQGDVDATDVPSASWLLNAATRILDTALDDEEDAKKEIILMASALEAISSSLEISSADDISKDAYRVVRILTNVLSTKVEANQKTVLHKAALRLISLHAFTLRHELVKKSGVLFNILMRLRVGSNRELNQLAIDAFEQFLPAISSAFKEGEIFPDRSTRGNLLKTVLKTVFDILDKPLAAERSIKSDHGMESEPTPSHRSKTCCIRALGKLAEPAFLLLEDEFAKVNTYTSRLGKLTMYMKFKLGGNEYVTRHESMERQVSLISAYSDLLRLEDVAIDVVLLQILENLVDWTWEHYAFEIGKRRPFVLDTLVNFFVVISSRGCTLQTILSNIGSRLLALTLRFSPPDPIDRVLYLAQPEAMWPRYVDLWTALLGAEKQIMMQRERFQANNVEAAVTGLTSSFVTEFLHLCETLDLGIVAVSEEDENLYTDSAVDTIGVAVSLGDKALAANPGDMQTFLQLVQFVQEVIEHSPATSFLPWINHLSIELMSMANKHRSISGFYKLIGVVITVARRVGYFRHSSPASEEVVILFKNFMRDVLHDTKRFSGELLAAVLQLLLSLPDVILSIDELVAPLLRALELGLQYPVGIHVALDTLEGWLSESFDQVSPHLSKISAQLCANLDSACRLNVFFSEHDIETLSKQENSRRRGKQQSKSIDLKDVTMQTTCLRIVKVLGMMGGAVHGLLSATSVISSELKASWDFESKVSVPIGLVRSSSRLRLDSLLPRTSHLALSSQDRATKVSAAEALYGVAVYLVGKNAQAPVSDARDYSRAESQYRSIFEKLFPVMFELAVDVEPVARQMFYSLVFQITRWYAKNQARELDLTLCLFDAIVVGLSNTSKGGAVRDLCASLTAEMMKWSIKYVPTGSTFETVSCRYILRTLFGLMDHAGVAHRLGAVAALRRCIVELATHRKLLDEHVLDILDVTVRCLAKSGERAAVSGLSDRGADAVTAILIHETLRIIKLNASWMLRADSYVSKSFDTFVSRTLLEASTSADDFLRRESQQAFQLVAELSFIDVKEWLRQRADLVSLYVDAAVPSMRAVDLSESQLMKFIAILQWSNWLIYLRYADAEFFKISRTTHFNAVGQYISGISRRLEVTFDSKDDEFHSIRQSTKEAHARLSLEILKLLTNVLTSSLGCADKDSLVLLIVGVGDEAHENASRLIATSIFVPQNLGMDASYCGDLARSGAQLLKTLSAVINQSSVAENLLNSALNNIRQMISCGAYDLGDVNLTSAQGCMDAKRLVGSYWALASAMSLDKVVPREGRMSASDLTRRVATKLYNLGQRVSPPQHAIGLVLLRLCIHLNVSAEILMDLLLDRGISVGDMKLGENFYRNYRDDIVRLCRYQFESYADELFKVASSDADSPSGVVASDIVLRVLECSQSQGSPKVQPSKVPASGFTVNFHTPKLLATLQKSIHHIYILYDGHRDKSADVRNACHQRFLAIARQAVLLHSTCEAESNLFNCSESRDVILRGVLSCVNVESMFSSSFVDAVVLIAEILKHTKLPEGSQILLHGALVDTLQALMHKEQCDSAETFMDRQPAIIQAFKKAFSICRLPALLIALLPFCKDFSEESLLLTIQSSDFEWNFQLAQNLWSASELESQPVNARLFGVTRILPALLSSSSAQDILGFFEANAESIMTAIPTSAGDIGLIKSLRSYAVLNEIYTKCDRAALTAGPCIQVPKLNSIVSKAVLTELAGKAAEPNLGNESNSLRRFQMAFTVFVSLLVLTQSNVKFFTKLFENAPLCWNKLVDRTSTLEMEAEWSAKTLDDVDAGKLSKTDAGFTLSSTLAALDSTLQTSAKISKAVEDDVKVKNDSPIDSFEAHPVADGLFNLLKYVVTNGLTGEIGDEHPESKVFQEVSNMLNSPELSCRVKLLIVKALLRANMHFMELLKKADSSAVALTAINVSPSLLVSHADLIIDSLSALHEIVRESGTEFISAPLREMSVISLECDVLWTSSFDEKKPILLANIELILQNAPTENPYVMRENVKLATRLLMRLRDAVVGVSSSPERYFQAALHKLLDHLAAKDEKKDFGKRATALQMIGSLLINNVIDLQQDNVTFMTASDGSRQGEGIQSDLCEPVLSCLMRSGSTTGRKLNSLAAALLGKIMKSSGDKSKSWHIFLKDKLTAYYATGSFDAFVDTLDRISISYPRYPHCAGFAPKVRALLDTLHGEQKIVALNLLTRDCSPDSVSGTCEELLPFVSSLVNPKDDRFLTLLFDALSRGLDAGLKSERSDVKLWQSALSAANAAVGVESVVKVREAHSRLCVAVAQVFPEIATDAAIQGPLLRALADHVNENQRTVLKFWNLRLANESLMERLRDVLCLVPSACSENLWLAAACRLMLAVQEMDPAFLTPLIENDLSECKLTTIAFDVTWRPGATRMMTPLFSEPSLVYEDATVLMSAEDAHKKALSLLKIPVGVKSEDEDPILAATLEKEFGPEKRLPSSVRVRPQQVRQPWQSEISTQKLGKAVRTAKLKKVEDFMIEHAKHGVKLTREYRVGDLPDVKISCRQLLAPFLVTAERDASLANSLLYELSRAAHDESRFIIDDIRGESDKSAWSIMAQPLVNFTSNVVGVDPSLVQFILSLCEAIPESKAPVHHIVRLAIDGNCRASGIVALEALIKSGNQSPEIWEALALLSKSLGYDDSALLAFINVFSERDTVEAIREDLLGKLQEARKRYKYLLDNESARPKREKELWNREYLRCAERLGEWDSLAEDLVDVFSGERKSTADIPESSIPGEASGGSSLFTAVRVALRVPLADDSFVENLITYDTDNLRILKNLGVEFALHALSKDRKDVAAEFLSQVHQSFTEAWSSTPTSAFAVRRKLIQSLQPAVEIDEMLTTIKRIEAIRMSQRRFNSAEANAEVEKLEKKWRKRWPSPRYDPSEVWERVVTFRSRLFGALVNIVPEIQTSAIVTLRTEMFLQAADGLREVGQVFLSQKFLRKYMEATTETQQKDWRYCEALFKLKLSGSGEALRKILVACQAGLTEDVWKSDERISATILEARICEQLAAHTQDRESRSFAKAAVRRYMDAVKDSGSIGDVGRISEASLRLAQFCDTMLKSLQHERSSSSECAEEINQWLHSSLGDSSCLTEVFIKHALKALETFGSGDMSARHLVPRLLVLLRADISPLTLRGYGSAILRVPTWLFLDWIPQLFSLLAERDEVVAPLLQRMISKYPAAVRPHFNLIKDNLDKEIRQRILSALVSSVHDGFNRAIELLDFPMNRLVWFRQQVQIREFQGHASEARKLLQRLIDDVASQDNSLFGTINARFAEVAGPVLRQAVSSCSGSRIHDALKQAEQRISTIWNDKYAGLESSSRLRLTEFSTWFASFEAHEASSVIEIPGQYDSIQSPPEIQKQVYITGFAPEARVFASKQRPKKITLRGSDGRDYHFIAKGSEDLRQDERVQRLFRAMDGLLAANPESRGRGLQVRTFHVSPISERCGLIEFLSNTSPLLGLVSKSAPPNENSFAQHQQFIKQFAIGLGKRKREDDHEVGPTELSEYLKVIKKPSRQDSVSILDELRRVSGAKDALRKVLFASAGSAESFVMMRQTFASSLAACSICGYIAGVGDRHLDNILLDTTTGSLVHIDFGYAFGTATTHLPIPELTPFRLTPVLLDVLAPWKARTWLETDMTRTMRALQQGSTLLQGVMDIFLREPLIDWEREALSTHAKTGANEGGHIQAKIARACGKLELDHPIHVVIDQCSIKHAHGAYWEDLNRLLSENISAPPQAKCHDVEEQVSTLIDLATNPEILAVAWSGWRPWL